MTLIRYSLFGLILVFISSPYFSAKCSNISEFLDVAAQYDIDYKGSSKSLYNSRFSTNKVIYREESKITKILTSVYRHNKNKPTIRILDFGCGDGRIFPVIEKFASKHTKTKFEIIAYDPSIVGLNEFINNLKQNGFISIDYNNNDNIIDTKPKDQPKDMSIIDILVRGNIEVKFLNNKVDAAPEHITYFTNGQIDAILAIYSSFNHIKGRDKGEIL
ncbi:MAG: hypothetical protein SFT93_04570 [Rickettsiaceae bacterium]|nr:hypothetical protein [Rickettsiaceae bacterium]